VASLCPTGATVARPGCGAGKPRGRGGSSGPDSVIGAAGGSRADAGRRRRTGRWPFQKGGDRSGQPLPPRCEAVEGA
jgi:hypothetical protein